MNPGHKNPGTCRITASQLKRARLGVMLLLTPPMVTAGDLYKWQDENGIWHFSDKPPASSSQQFDHVALPVEPKSMISERRAGPRHEPEHWFFNHYHGPAELELRLPLAENVKATPALPARVILPGQVEQRLVRFEALDPRQGFSYQLAYTMVPGAPVDRLPGDVDFFPPFPAGEEFPISQGFEGSSTHKDAANRFAVDIVMPIGTPVLAARGGIVMAVEDDFHGADQTERFMDRANRIRLLHNDGSMSVYAHLQPNSARVRPGDRVPPGAWIASSGNTGFSSGPHLHFVVQVNAGLALESMPFRFRQPGGTLTPEQRGMISGVLNAP